MREEIREVIKLAAMDNLAERAGLTPEQIQDARQALYVGMQPSPMPPAQPMPNQMQRPMNVRPADPQRMVNIQNVKQALESESPLDNLAMMRMQERAGGGTALESFSGQVPGDGHGMEDNVYMPIVDRGDQVATLAVSPDEYVVDAHTMSALGNGSADEGADIMDQIVKEVRQEAFGTTQQPNQINGLQSLRNKMIG